jgi:hypothetical protein
MCGCRAALLLLAALALAACRPARLDASAVLKQLRERPRVALEQPLDSEAAVSLAMANNRSLGPWREATLVARAQVKAATDIANPTVRVVVSDLNLAGREDLQLSARWSPPRPWEVAGEAALARAQVRVPAQARARDQDLARARVRAE